MDAGCRTDKLPVKVAAELSNLINKMLTGAASRKFLEENEPWAVDKIQYWYEFQLEAERGLQALGIHLSSPLE